jgi:hypothetical protein
VIDHPNKVVLGLCMLKEACQTIRTTKFESVDQCQAVLDQLSVKCLRTEPQLVELVNQMQTQLNKKSENVQAKGSINLWCTNILHQQVDKNQVHDQ